MRKTQSIFFDRSPLAWLMLPRRTFTLCDPWLARRATGIFGILPHFQFEIVEATLD